AFRAKPKASLRALGTLATNSVGAGERRKRSLQCWLFLDDCEFDFANFRQSLSLLRSLRNSLFAVPRARRLALGLTLVAAPRLGFLLNSDRFRRAYVHAESGT